MCRGQLGCPPSIDRIRLNVIADVVRILIQMYAAGTIKLY